MKKIWAKIEDGRIVYPPKNDKESGMFNVDKNEKWLVENGFVLRTPEELEPYQPKPVELPKKYPEIDFVLEAHRMNLELFREGLSSPRTVFARRLLAMTGTEETIVEIQAEKTL